MRHTTIGVAKNLADLILAKATPIIYMRSYHDGFTKGREAGKVEAHIETEGAKREERERITGEIESQPGFGMFLLYVMSKARWQALKGE